MLRNNKSSTIGTSISCRRTWRKFSCDQFVLLILKQWIFLIQMSKTLCKSRWNSRLTMLCSREHSNPIRFKKFWMTSITRMPHDQSSLTTSLRISRLRETTSMSFETKWPWAWIWMLTQERLNLKIRCGNQLQLSSRECSKCKRIIKVNSSSLSHRNLPGWEKKLFSKANSNSHQSRIIKWVLNQSSRIISHPTSLNKWEIKIDLGIWWLRSMKRMSKGKETWDTNSKRSKTCLLLSLITHFRSKVCPQICPQVSHQTWLNSLQIGLSSQVYNQTSVNRAYPQTFLNLAHSQTSLSNQITQASLQTSTWWSASHRSTQCLKAKAKPFMLAAPRSPAQPSKVAQRLKWCKWRRLKPKK